MLQAFVYRGLLVSVSYSLVLLTMLFHVLTSDAVSSVWLIINVSSKFQEAPCGDRWISLQAIIKSTLSQSTQLSTRTIVAAWFTGWLAVRSAQDSALVSLGWTATGTSLIRLVAMLKP